MKIKILKVLCIAMFIISICTINSFAIINSATAHLTASKSSYNLDDENEIISVTLRLDNLQSNNGIIAYSATLEYDTNKLTYLDCSGAGRWSVPSYEAGKLVADRADNDFSPEGEDLCTIRFKAKSAGNNISIKLTNIELSSGELGGRGLKAIDDADVQINITTSQSSNPGGSGGNQGETTNPSGNTGNTGNQGGNTQNPDNNNGQNNNNGNNNNNNNGNNNGINSENNNGSNNTGNNGINNSNNNGSNNSNNSSTTSNNKIPKLGANTYFITIPIIIAFAIAIALFIKIKLLNVKIKKESKDIIIK